MLIANKFGYPSVVVAAAERSQYQPKKGTIGVSALVGPPLVRTLALKHWDKIVVDVDDLLVRMMGSAWHSYLEGIQTDLSKDLPHDQRPRVEQFVRSVFDHQIVTGCVDFLHNGILADYKLTSAWSIVFGKPEWEQQLNVYAELAERNGYPVVTLRNYAFLKDWDEYKAAQQGDYPKSRFVTADVPLWDSTRRVEFIRQRIEDHRNNPERECNPEEKWQKPDAFAVMKAGRKTALRVLGSETDAAAWIAENKPDGKVSVVKRAGSCQRCAKYCQVAAFCPFKQTVVED